MNAKAILVAAVMLGGVGGYGWAALDPAAGEPAPASQSQAMSRLAHGPRTIIADAAMPDASDREWASRGDDSAGDQSAAPARDRAVEQSAYYSGCNEARAAGKAPLYAGQPGYRSAMDGDGDGVACEPIRG